MPQRSGTLDWFRGIGILAVLWGHAGLSGLPGAYLFIDTFFVISGYLVSKSLIKAVEVQAEEGRLSIKGPLLVFFSNRIRRIVIPLATTVLLTLVAGWFILLPDDLFKLGQSAQATLFLHAHIYALTLGSYFDVVDGNTPLLHTWSLSLEEWFYIVTPFLVLPTLLWNRFWWLVVLCGIGMLSLHLAQNMSTDPEYLGASYSMFQTRVWQFILGAVAAILLQRRPALRIDLNDGILGLGITVVFASVLVMTDKAASPGYITLPTVLGVLAVLILRPQTKALTFLTGSALVGFFGRKLYSLYLAHYPFMIYFDYLELNFGIYTDLIRFGGALVFSLAFYYMVEAPVNGWRAISFLKVVSVSGILILSSLALSVHILRTGGAPTRMPDAALAAWTARFDTSKARAECVQGQLTRFGYSCALGPRDGKFFALFGDSHSEVFANQLSRILAKDGIGLRHYWYAECPLIGSGLSALGAFSDTCGKIAHEAHRNVLGDVNLSGIIYAARWPWYLNEGNPDLLRAYWRGADGLPRNYASMAEFRADFGTVLDDSLKRFSARGVPV
jgi:peptidoglycan/LPS O-acetylase OafA/YrhL